MKRFICIFLSISLVGCGLGKKKSESPEFDPDEILTISGQFLAEGGTPLANTPVHLKNLRFDSYIDYTKAVIHTSINIVATYIIAAWAFPFYLFGKVKAPLTPTAPGVEGPDYFLEKITTDLDGNFAFKVRAGNFLRAQDGGINIELINKKGTNQLFGKFKFVIKDADSALGSLSMCSLGGLKFTENTDDITISWEAAPGEVVKYVTNFGLSPTNALLWSVATDQDTRSINLPKSVFNDFSVKVATQAYYIFEDQKKLSCLSEPLVFNLADPTPSLAAGSTAEVSNIKFKVIAFGDGKLDDPVFLQAFGPQEVILDLQGEKTFQHINLHNLTVSIEGETTFSTSSDKDNWTEVGKESDLRFMTHKLTEPVTARYLKITFGSKVADLKEITIN
jgi:hypothetical protein